MNAKPLHLYRMQLAFRAVHIEILDAEKNVLKNATGFIMKDGGRHFLYTCWHVVTGYDPHNIQVGQRVPNRIFLRINFQNSEMREPGVTAIGGKQTCILTLYDRVELPRKPLWFQDRQHLPHPDLNNINIKVPFWHDAVKLSLPEDLNFVDMQVIPDDEKWQNLVPIGDKVLIVGYPYGFSAAGLDQPTPIVLTRHIAADRMKGMRREVLLDGPGTPGMSGAPVFIEQAHSTRRTQGAVG